MGLVVAAAAVSALALAQNAGNQPKSAAEAKAAIESRQNLFKDIKKAYEPMTAMLKQKLEFDAGVVATNAARIQELAQKIPAQHALDTRQFKDTKTDALDGIWASQADFKAKSDALVTASANAAAVAKTDNKGATLKAIADMGKTCGACHDNYKGKDRPRTLGRR
jgi:cytochrome c556